MSSHTVHEDHKEFLKHVDEPHVHNNIIVEKALAAHNTYRLKHGSPPLVWDDALSDNALKAAQSCFDEGKPKHSNCDGEGQNIYYSAKSGQPNMDGSKEATAGWYSEIKKYDFDKPCYREDTGHFTQVVWSGTKKVGMAKVKGLKDGMERVYIVANYAPAGNDSSKGEGEFRKNVGVLVAGK